ncbi:MAG: T9SS type A sorting domain-containing protein [bacterium]
MVSELQPYNAIRVQFDRWLPIVGHYIAVIIVDNPSDVNAANDTSKVHFEVLSDPIIRNYHKRHRAWPPWNYCQYRIDYYLIDIGVSARVKGLDSKFLTSEPRYLIAGASAPYNEAGEIYLGWTKAIYGAYNRQVDWWAVAPYYYIPSGRRAIFPAWTYWGWQLPLPVNWRLRTTAGDFYGTGTCSYGELYEQVFDYSGFDNYLSPDRTIDDDFSTYTLCSNEDNYIVYDRGCATPLTHLVLISRNVPVCCNPREIEISVGHLDNGTIDTVITRVNFPPLRNGNSCAVPLFPEGWNKALLKRYIRIKILTRWNPDGTGILPAPGAQFSEIIFMQAPIGDINILPLNKKYVGAPGTNLLFYFRVVNAGLSEHTLSCSINDSLGWSMIYSNLPFPLGAQKDTALSFIVPIPPDANIDQENSFKIKITALDDQTQTDSTHLSMKVTYPAEIEIKPSVLNLKSQGRWITCFVELPSNFSPSDIDLSQTYLQYKWFVVNPDTTHYQIGDYNNNGIPDLMLKFSRDSVIYTLGNINTPCDVHLTLVTALLNEKEFTGFDSIKIIGNKSGKQGDEYVIHRIPLNFVIFPNVVSRKNKVTIAYTVPNQSEVCIKIYDITGRQVAKISEGSSFGYHRLEIVPEKIGISSGVYFAQFSTSDTVIKKRLLIY